LKHTHTVFIFLYLLVQSEISLQVIGYTSFASSLNVCHCSVDWADIISTKLIGNPEY